MRETEFMTAEERIVLASRRRRLLLLAAVATVLLVGAGIALVRGPRAESTGHDGLDGLGEKTARVFNPPPIRDGNGGLDGASSDAAESEAWRKGQEEARRRRRERAARAIPLMEQFLAARTVEERLPLVRHPARVGPLMREFYSRTDRPPEGRIGRILAEAVLDIGGQEFSVASFEFEDGSRGAMAVTEEDGRLGIDWESFVAYGDLPVGVFLDERPTEAVLLRLYAELGDYHNHEFSDERRWISVRLHDRLREHVFHGFCEADSETGRSLAGLLGGRRPGNPVAVTVRLAFTPGSRAPDCVRIEELVHVQWITPPGKALAGPSGAPVAGDRATGGDGN